MRDRALEPLRIHVVTDEAEEVLGQSAERALGDQLLQPLDRGNDVDVEVGVIVRILQLMDAQILVTRGGWNRPEPKAAEWVANVESGNRIVRPSSPDIVC